MKHHSCFFRDPTAPASSTMCPLLWITSSVLMGIATAFHVCFFLGKKYMHYESFIWEFCQQFHYTLSPSHLEIHKFTLYFLIKHLGEKKKKSFIIFSRIFDIFEYPTNGCYFYFIQLSALKRIYYELQVWNYFQLFYYILSFKNHIHVIFKNPEAEFSVSICSTPKFVCSSDGGIPMLLVTESHNNSNKRNIKKTG